VSVIDVQTAAPLEPAPLLVAGSTLCNVCRDERAILVWEPQERWAEPLCADCADDRIERGEVAALYPAQAARISRARQETARPLPRPPVRWDKDMERELRLFRIRYQAQAERPDEEERCIAIVAAGRCVRRAQVGGDGWEGRLCETHSLNGCRLPGLGWRDGSPTGRIIARPGRSRA